MRRIIGNVGCFQLPDGRYGFGRIFNDVSVAFYKHIGASETDLPTEEKNAFIVSVYNSGVTRMKLVEKRPYISIEEVTSPPTKIHDPITGKYSQYINGKIFPSSFEECKDLETCAVWELDHVIDRLMGNDKWNL
jgi:hypothetical protein